MASHATKSVKPNPVNQLDCNGYSTKYKSLDPEGRGRCTDPMNPRGQKVNGKWHATQFEDNGHYIGHDEPSVKFISHARGSGNTMTYVMKLPRRPEKQPTANGSVTEYGELSIAPWFGLPMCDPNSYPQNPCKPDSDSQHRASAPRPTPGSAFMELQFYPPGFAPFADNVSCTRHAVVLGLEHRQPGGHVQFRLHQPSVRGAGQLRLTCSGTACRPGRPARSSLTSRRRPRMARR